MGKINIILCASTENLFCQKTDTIPIYGKLVPIDLLMCGNIFFQFIEKRWKYPYLSHSWILRHFSCVWLLNYDLFHRLLIIGVPKGLCFRNKADLMQIIRLSKKQKNFCGIKQGQNIYIFKNLKKTTPKYLLKY